MKAQGRSGTDLGSSSRWVVSFTPGTHRIGGWVGPSHFNIIPTRTPSCNLDDIIRSGMHLSHRSCSQMRHDGRPEAFDLVTPSWQRNFCIGEKVSRLTVDAAIAIFILLSRERLLRQWDRLHELQFLWELSTHTQTGIISVTEAVFPCWRPSEEVTREISPTHLAWPLSKRMPNGSGRVHEGLQMWMGYNQGFGYSASPSLPPTIQLRPLLGYFLTYSTPSLIWINGGGEVI
jgi:hypothetical protein